MVEQESEMILPEVIVNEENAKKKIAVIGGGPAGISCAYFLARLGYSPVIFEKESRPGGMLVQTIPAYRLPRETLAKEIRMVENMGVTIVTEQALGKDFTLQSLRDDGFDAIFVGIGAPNGIQINIPGYDADGVDDAIAFLREYNIRGSVPIGKSVIVVGGGNAAIDAARTAVRLGAEKVTVLYRRTREEMPAYLEEIEEALQEGVVIESLTMPEEIVVAEGKVTGISCRHMQLGEFDRSGRRRPEADQDDVFVIDADQVIMAVGQSADDSAFADDIDRDDRGWVTADAITCQTSIKYVFTGGDAATGPMSVVHAIGDGERAAVGIDQFLTGENHAFWRVEKDNTTDYDPESEPVPYPREQLRMMPVSKRCNNFDEVEQSWNESEAVRQARRCLRCDYGKLTIC